LRDGVTRGGSSPPLPTELHYTEESIVVPSLVAPLDGGAHIVRKECCLGS
jgi:hypothetical protein